MSDDLVFLKEHLPDYAGYADEEARHDTDMRVRAFVGERLTAALARLAGELTPEAAAAGEQALLQCMFTDQGFIRRIEHAELDDAALGSLAAADRRLVETAASADAVAPDGFGALVEALDRRFAQRHDPLPATI